MGDDLSKERLRNLHTFAFTAYRGIPTTSSVANYSWESAAHKEWVRNLAARLIGDGVKVTLDQWHAVPGDQLPEFMEREIISNK